MRITEATRRDIFDALRLETTTWSGRLDEAEFLGRVFNLRALPSHDHRFHDAAGDIRQHRVNNYDWSDDWIYNDSRFDLLGCEDETFLRFLRELLHPVVRADKDEVERLRLTFNKALREDGYELVECDRVSGRPLFNARLTAAQIVPATQKLKTAFEHATMTYVVQQITRMEAAIEVDPGLAIGTAKELVETCCKTILFDRNLAVDKSTDLPSLVKQAAKALALTPDDIPEQARAAETIRRLLSNLGSITTAVAELRNLYGTGHGKDARAKGLQARHARLAVGAASTLALFLIETHEARR
jgi:hypothetical protein